MSYWDAMDLSSPDDVEPEPEPPRWPIKRRPYFGDFIFDVAKGHVVDWTREAGYVDVILLKASWKWLWRRRRGVGPWPSMETVDDLFLRGRNMEADFGGYGRRRQPVQVVSRMRSDRLEVDMADPVWVCSKPKNEIGWLVVASTSGVLITAHQFQVTTMDIGDELRAAVGTFGFAVYTP